MRRAAASTMFRRAARPLPPPAAASAPSSAAPAPGASSGPARGEQPARDGPQLRRRVGLEVEDVREARRQAGVPPEQGGHLRGVPREDDDDVAPPVLEELHERVEGLAPERVLVALHERVGLVHEQHAAARAVEGLPDLERRLPHVRRDERAPVALDDPVARPHGAERAERPRQQPRDRRLARAGRPPEDAVQARAPLHGHAVPPPLPVQPHLRRQGPDVLLHAREAHDAVERRQRGGARVGPRAVVLEVGAPEPQQALGRRRAARVHAVRLPPERAVHARPRQDHAPLALAGARAARRQAPHEPVRPVPGRVHGEAPRPRVAPHELGQLRLGVVGQLQRHGPRRRQPRRRAEERRAPRLVHRDREDRPLRAPPLAESVQRRRLAVAVAEVARAPNQEDAAPRRVEGVGGRPGRGRRAVAVAAAAAPPPRGLLPRHL